MTTLIVALWVAVYAAAAAIAVGRQVVRSRRARRAPSRDALERAVLLRPCAGDEVDLATRLAHAGGARSVVLAVGSFADLATPSAGVAVLRLHGAGLSANLVQTHAVGPNHKVDQLARALAIASAARGKDIVIVADSDVDLEQVDLAQLVAELDDEGVGAAWAPPVEAGAVVAAGDAVSQAVLDASLHAFPLLAGIDPNGMVGKLFAIRREVLEAVGGFEALRVHLGEDMELARRLRARGLRVVASPMVAPARAEGRSLAAVHARYVRWLQVVRAQRGALLASYPLLLAPAPLLLVMAIAGAFAGVASIVVSAAVGVLVRVAVATCARTAAGLSPSPLVATGQALVADVALLAALASALRSRRVAWRTGELRVGPGGTLVETAR